MFPLRGVILLPRTTLPLNVFEPRYLAMISDVLAGERMLAVLQPKAPAGDEQSPEGKTFPLRTVGGIGRLTAFSETDDGRILITLTGICRLELAGETETEDPYRTIEADYEPYADDLIRGEGEDAVDRDRLLTVLKTYLEAHELTADWDSINHSTNERLVNTLSMISPYGAEEKQALLEAPDLKSRAEVLVALAEMELAARDDGTESTMQ
ncbi:MAG: LON peptidase substrate-binding domain-containing protein [Hyphomicrobiales bacterium]|nr:LON peptidase substrate-binding domain-containing protein [Hyphomicrobiales bacterium]